MTSEKPEASLREKIAEAVAQSHGCDLEHGYGAANRERFETVADRILALPEIAEMRERIADLESGR